MKVFDWDSAQADFLKAAEVYPEDESKARFVKSLRQKAENARQKSFQKKMREAIAHQPQSHITRPATPGGPIPTDEEVVDSFTLDSAKDFMYQMVHHTLPNTSSVISILTKMRRMHADLPNIVRINQRNLKVVGDTHGQFPDVVALFEEFGFPSKENPYLFNGDFVDRGTQGSEIVLTLLAFKIADPECIFLNRGNHETETMNSIYGFEKEADSKFKGNMYKHFSSFFDSLPLGHIVNDRVFIVHGGLFSDDGVTIDSLNAMTRFGQPPESGPLNDILWSDPMTRNGLAPSPRGVTRTFGPDITEKFLNENHLELLVRSHQVQEKGYDVMHNGKCITVFSAPNYCGIMKNLGAILEFEFNEDGSIKNKEFKTFHEHVSL